VFFRIINREYDGVYYYDVYKEGFLFVKDLDKRKIIEFIANYISYNDTIEGVTVKGTVIKGNIKEWKKQALEEMFQCQ
jgi:hypothetical protein